jgi:sortase (surface protein transpeptidase)
MVQDDNPAPEEQLPDQAGNGSEAPPLTRRPLAVAGAFGAVVIVGIILVAVALGGGGGNDDGKRSGGSANAGIAEQATPQATIDLARPTAAPTGNLNVPSIEGRMLIPKIGVDAPLSYKVVGTDGLPPNPNGPDDIAYYDLTAWPGKGGAPGIGGNAVFAGHVDWGAQHGVGCKNNTVRPPCQAVLWDLGKLAVGDEIRVNANGGSYRYRVTANDVVNATTAPWEEIYASTAKETLTLITCTGVFTGEYDKRVVVTAERVT